MRPAVSVLLPIYRPRHDYLLPAIKSILCQTFADFELLLIEAPSEISIEEVLQQVQDARLRHLRFPGPASLVDQLNYGLLEAKAALIARMDGDDWSYPERLHRQHDYLQTNPQITVLGTQISIMDAKDHPLGYRCYPTEPDAVSKALRRSNVLAHPSVMYRREPVLAAGGYWYREYPANEDYELWCRLNRCGHQLANLDETLLRYRIHAGAMKSEKLKNILRGTRLVKRHYYADTMNAGEWSRYSAERRSPEPAWLGDTQAVPAIAISSGVYMMLRLIPMTFAMFVSCEFRPVPSMTKSVVTETRSNAKAVPVSTTPEPVKVTLVTVPTAGLRWGETSGLRLSNRTKRPSPAS